MSKCEKCNIENEGTYGSGRFCSSKCARSFSTSKKRKEINKKISKRLSSEKRRLQKYVQFVTNLLLKIGIKETTNL